MEVSYMQEGDFVIGSVGSNYTMYPIYNNYLNGDQLRIPNVTKVQGSEYQPKTLKGLDKTEKLECQTCQDRKYIDESNDSNVSFKTPAHISPEASLAAVSSHEQEHVSNAVSEGSKPGAELVSASVTLKTGICPECGKTYIAGGTTTTQMKYTDVQNPYQQDRKKQDELLLKGLYVDYAA